MIIEISEELQLLDSSDFAKKAKELKKKGKLVRISYAPPCVLGLFDGKTRYLYRINDYTEKNNGKLYETVVDPTYKGDIRKVVIKRDFYNRII